MLVALILSLLLQPSSQVEVVESVRAAVLAAGIDLAHGPGECGRWEITRRVAWLLRAEGYGLIAKGGNNCEGYAVDALMLRDGTVIDILGPGDVPQWLVQPSLRPASDWREPVAVAEAPAEPSPPPVPPAPTALSPELQAQFDRLLFRLDQLEALERADSERVEGRINEVVNNAKRSAAPLLLKILSLGLAQ